MKAKAAIAWKAGAPLTVEEVGLEGPKAGKVLIEVKATGICHTDYYTLSGADPEGIFPSILSHEGAGVVLDVGPDVKSLRAGDHVIPFYTPECRQGRSWRQCGGLRASRYPAERETMARKFGMTHFMEDRFAFHQQALNG